MPFSATESDAPWELLAKQLAGEATPAELQELAAWVAGRPERQALLEQVTGTWQLGGEEPTAFTQADEDRAWARFQNRIQLEDILPIEAPVQVAPATRVVPMWSNTQTWMQLAAAVALLIGAVFLFRVLRPGTATGTAQVVAATDQRRTVTLPDGSKVWLNKHSTLRYAAAFNDEERVVALEGEGFFEVKKDHGRPFTVLAADTRTRVLGTSFNVRAYGREDSVEVAVVTGKVSFQPATQALAATDSALLTPGLRGVIRKSAPKVVVQQPITDPNFRAWQQDELVFDNQSLAQVAQTLSRQYGTTIALANPTLGQCRFTGTFEHADLPQMLRIVSVSANLSVTLSADGYILDGQGCQ